MEWYWFENPEEEEEIGLDGHGHEVRSHNLHMLYRNTCTPSSRFNLSELRSNRRKQEHIGPDSSIAWRELPHLPHFEENKHNQEPLVGHATISWRCSK